MFKPSTFFVLLKKMKRSRSAERGNSEEIKDEEEARLAASRARREAILSRHKQSMTTSVLPVEPALVVPPPPSSSASSSHSSQSYKSSATNNDESRKIEASLTTTTTTTSQSSSSSSSSNLRSSSSAFDIFGDDDGNENENEGSEGGGLGPRASEQRDARISSRSGIEAPFSRPGGAPNKGAVGSDNADDADGYYRLRVGELIFDRYLVLGTRGKGVFSSVLYCKDTKATAEANSLQDSQGMGGGGGLNSDKDMSTIREIASGETTTSRATLAVGKTGALVKRHAALATGSSAHVAIKVIRSNDTMRRACMKEIEILRELNTADPSGRYHCVRLLHHFEHAGHICLVFEPLAMNLKEVQDKFGTGVGLSVQGVQEFARQLLLSLALLAKLRIIHADIKPHNILSTESYRTIKMADFGSALRANDETDVTPTPYMQSRFYRAPEVILGCRITAAIDMWSVACVLYELFTGHPLFPGIDNNDMLFKMQSTVGRISQKIIRRHLQHAASMGLDPHFEEASVGGSGPSFRRHVKDPISGSPGIKLLDFTFVKAADEIKKRLESARAEGDDKRIVQNLASLLVFMLNPDPTKRITVSDALKHPFIERK